MINPNMPQQLAGAADFGGAETSVTGPITIEFSALDLYAAHMQGKITRAAAHNRKRMDGRTPSPVEKHFRKGSGVAAAITNARATRARNAIALATEF